MGVKGDWKRPTNPNHTPDWIRNQADMGRCGCARGFHFYVQWKKCKYCGKIKGGSDNDSKRNKT